MIIMCSAPMKKVKILPIKSKFNDGMVSKFCRGKKLEILLKFISVNGDTSPIIIIFHDRMISGDE